MFLTLFAAAALAEEPVDLAARATGTLKSTDAASVIEGRRQAAIERTLEPMNFALAVLARGKLEDTLTACSMYTAKLDGDVFTFQCDDKGIVTTTLGGGAAPFTNQEGKTYMVNSSKRGETVLDVVFQGDSGAQTTSFDFSGEIVVVTKTVTSDMLEVPLSCTFNYR